MAKGAIREFLGTKILESNFIYIDLWSVVHLIVGYLMWSWLGLEFILALGLIILYELFEGKISMFRAENMTDKIWDVILGVIGYIIAKGGI